ncbi:MAG TPA: hypothetical protein VIG73_12965 [Cerasibacillus sp.]|uniref:hypothetical protein n=1 Tax=Cerasibacillus sp. TaxID=2498711 RepID=UPI002F3F4D9C
MSLPNIPDIDPNITLDRCEVINLLLSSIAMEEIGISHILNAEGEKIQRLLKNNNICVHDYFKLNKEINQMLRSIVKSQLLLQMKLEDVVTIFQNHSCKHLISNCKCKHDKQKCKKSRNLHSTCNCKRCENNHGDNCGSYS